jgi:hypothetical protein
MHSDIKGIPVEMQLDAIETRADAWGQDVLLRHLDLPAGTDFRPLLAGLPGDRCSCPHYGYVLEGSITVEYADGTRETTSAGEVYYWPGGHTGWTDDGVVFLEWSPTAEIQPVLEHIANQLGVSA